MIISADRAVCRLGIGGVPDGRGYAALTRAIECDATLAAAWVNRAILAFGNGEVDAAISDLTEALNLGDDPVIRYNRAVAHQHGRRWQQAIDDFTQALLLDPGGAEEILIRRAACHREPGQTEEARRDLDEHTSLRTA
ncbi:hypothetical protein GCM10023196_066180 [Actinoallomurus vinaceus]|uniref:Tetratricopeptide repeat protein n=1 Tax=Actinoallomurus vinaceus TaxID=1080074 RepID=A0ABP8UKY2_9ACTN